MKNFRLCDSLASSHLLTVVQSAAWNWSTMVNSAGSMYQMLAKMKEMMERLATLHTNPISTSSSQAVKLFHCAAQNSLHPFLFSLLSLFLLTRPYISWSDAPTGLVSLLTLVSVCSTGVSPTLICSSLELVVMVSCLL